MTKREPETCALIAGPLRLAKKYIMEGITTELVRILERDWPDDYTLWVLAEEETRVRVLTEVCSSHPYNLFFRRLHKAAQCHLLLADATRRRNLSRNSSQKSAVLIPECQKLVSCGSRFSIRVPGPNLPLLNAVGILKPDDVGPHISRLKSVELALTLE